MPKHQTFVDYFTHEFMEELWYLQKIIRGDIPKRAEVDPWENFFNVTQGLLSLAPIPGLPLGFLLSKELVKQCVKYGGIALKAAQQANAAAQANYKKGKQFLEQVDSAQEKYESIAGKAESKGMLQQEGPMDLTAIRVLVELIGRGLVERYEHVLSDYLGDPPDKSQIPLARVMAKRLFQYLQSQPLLSEGLSADLLAQRTRLLNGVLLGNIDKSWREQLTSKASGILPRVIKDMHKIELPLQAVPKKQLSILEKFTAEGVIKRSAWYDDKQIYAHPKTEWWGEKGKAAQPKYGYAYIADPRVLPKDSKELSASSSYSTPPRTDRYYQPVNVADIQAYLATPEIKAARTAKQTASLSFHAYLHRQGRPQDLQAVCHDDLTAIKDWSFANFSGVDFSGAQITGNISGADFSSSYLVGITATAMHCQQDHPVNLSRAQLGFADLRGAKLPKANLTQAELQLTNLSGTDLTAIHSEGTNWYKTDLTGVTRQDLLAEQAKQVAETQQQFAARMKALDDRLMQTELELVDLQARVEELEKQQSAGDNNAEILQKIAALQTQMAEKVNREFQTACEAELRELRKDITELRTDVDQLKVQIQDIPQLQRQLSQLEKRFAGQITLTLTGAGDVGRKILVEQTTVQLTHHAKDLEFYLPPTVIERLPEKLTLDDLMAQLNALPRSAQSSSVTTTSSSSSTTTETKAERKEHKGEAVGGGDIELASGSAVALPKRFDAITVIDQFLTQEENLLVLLGEPGAGKTLSTWQATRRLMAQFQPEMTGQQISQCWLPIHIELNQFGLSELPGILDRQLKTYGLNETTIAKLKQATPGQTLEPKVLLILDGYDELRQQAGENRRDHTDLFKRIGGEGWKKGQLKVLVTCRRRYLQSDDEERMMFGVGQYQRYQRFELLPFTLEQTKDYITARSSHDVGGGLLKAERYFSSIEASDSLKKLVSSPFVLQLFLESLPRLAQSGQDTRHITRFDLYREFFDQWLEREVRRLTAAKKEALGRDSDVVLVKDFKRLARYLALSMYANNTITVIFNKPQQPNVEYSLWYAVLKQVVEEANQECQALEAQSGESEDDLFGLGSAKPKPDKATLMRQAQARANQLADILPLTRSGNSYKFVHKSFYEYLVAAGIVDLANNDLAFEAAALNFLKQRLIQTEPAVVAYITELARPTQSKPHAAYSRLRPKLFETIQRSAKELQLGQASSNAATLLNVCEENLIGQSWANVQLPGADLSYCVLAHSDLSGANLQGATLIHTVLYKTNLQGADLRGVKWGEFPHLKLKEDADAIAWHPTKPIIAVAQGKTILQLNSETGEQIGSPLTGHTSSVECVAYRPDGRRLVSGSYDNTVRQWDAETGQAIGVPLTGHTGKVTSVAYRPDGRRLVSGSYDNTVRQWDAETGEPIGALLTGHTSYVSSVAYRPDGRRLVSGGWDKTLRQWDTETGAPLGAPLTGHTGNVASVAYRPDGRRLVSGGWDKTLRQWDAETGEQIGAPLTGHTEEVTSVAYRPDGHRLVSGSDDRTVRQWDADTGKQIGAPLTGHTGKVTSVAYRPDGRRLVSGGGALFGRKDHTLRQWDADTGKQIGAPLTGHTGKVTSVAYRPDGRRLVSGSSDKTLRQWDAETGQAIGVPLTGHTEEVRSVAYCPAGRRLASGGGGLFGRKDHTVQQWDAETGEQIGAPLAGHTNYVTSVTYRPDGRCLVSGSNDKTLRQWDAETGEPIGTPLTGHTNSVNCVAYHPAGRRLVSGGGALFDRKDHTVRQWDAETGQAIGVPLTGHTGEVTSVVYRPDGRRLVSGSSDKTLRQWDSEIGKQIGAPLTGHTGSVECVVYRPDGRRLVSGGGYNDDTVRQWDAESGQCLVVLQWHQAIYSIALIAAPFNPSETRVAESKNLIALPEAKASEDWLAMGDVAGTISFWAISDAGFRLVAMPKHNSMPLMANGANLKDCQMSAMSKRLLEQHGADVSQVVVVNEADHGVHNKSDTKLTRDSKVEAKVIATSSAASTVQSVTPLVTRKEPTSIPKMVVTAPQTLPPKVEAKVTITTAVTSTSSSSQTTASPAKTGFFAKLLGRKSVTTASYSSVSASQTRSPGPSSPQSPADAKAQNLLKELYALVDEVYPANDSTVAKQRSDYLAKLQPYQDRRATLTPGDRGKLRQLQSELETIQAAACQPAEVGME